MHQMDSKTEPVGWFGRQAAAEAAAGAAPSLSDAQIQAANGSVRALIADLRYIMGKEPADQWSTLASAALQHHSPPVADQHLALDFRRLQTAGREALTGLCQGSFEVIRCAVLEIREIESRL